MLPAGARYVKAFGTLDAGSLANSANREPRRAALLYATDDGNAAAPVERLMTVSGFDPVKAEMPGGDLAGRLLNAQEAKAALTSA
jgi:8-hydroxy-5-deazaflavin:NADPH oxidoreductase